MRIVFTLLGSFVLFGAAIALLAAMNQGGSHVSEHLMAVMAAALIGIGFMLGAVATRPVPHSPQPSFNPPSHNQPSYGQPPYGPPSPQQPWPPQQQ